MRVEGLTKRLAQIFDLLIRPKFFGEINILLKYILNKRF